MISFGVQDVCVVCTMLYALLCKMNVCMYYVICFGVQNVCLYELCNMPWCAK